MQTKVQRISPVKQRILEFAATLRISKREFYAKIDVSRGTLESKTGITEDVVAKFIAIYPEVNVEWLITGNGEMIKTKSTLHHESVCDNPLTGHKDNIEKASNNGINEILLRNNEMMKTEGEKKDESGGDLHADERHDAGQLPLATPVTIPGEGIPLLPIDAMAGALTGDVSVLPYECEYYYVPVFTGADFLITVSGNSMNPTFQSGDIVACKRVPLSGLFFQWGKIYIIDTTQGPLIKRIKPAPSPDHITIVSDNTDYDPFQLPASEIRAVALVVGVIRLE